MNLISYEDFGKLRLSEIFPNNNDVVGLNDFKFMDDIWIGECYGFTEWLRLEAEPQTTRSISIDLVELPNNAVRGLFQKIGLGLRKGMTEDEIISMLGKPQKIETFTDDRKSFNYVIGDSEKYYLSLTIHQENGLVYVVLMNHIKTVNSLLQS